MGDEVRVTVIAAGFDRWDEKTGRETARPQTNRTGETPAARPPRSADLFGPEGDDDDSDGDEFDVPEFLR